MAAVTIPATALLLPTKAVDVTPAAGRHIKKILARESGKMMFRLSVKKLSGCLGHSYVMDYVTDLNADDLQFSVDDDLVIFVERSSLRYLRGICIDYIQDEHGLNGSLQFINPNQAAACGCGKSFSVEEN